MQLLINKDDFFKHARYTDKNINYEVKIEPIVSEVQQSELKPQIGDDFLLRLLDYVNDDAHTPNELFDTLLNGGNYIDKCGNKKIIEGIKKTASYYTWAHLLLSQNSFLGVIGNRQANDSTSNLADYKLTKDLYYNTKQLAESYMTDCLSYMQVFRDELGIKCEQRKKRKTNINVIQCK